MIITILAFIFVISLLIVAHEFGHFIMAKMVWSPGFKLRYRLWPQVIFLLLG